MQMYTRDGTLVAVTVQEGVIRARKDSGSKISQKEIQSKL